jgi:hypothetical protein
MGYLETRSGPQFGSNDPLHMNLERFGFQVFRPDEDAHDLNAMSDQAINTRQWGVRVLHGVEDDSWGRVSYNDYIIHMKHLREKIDSNLLWVSTPTPILTYLRAERDAKLIHVETSKHHETYTLKGTHTGDTLTVKVQPSRTIKKIKNENHSIEHSTRAGIVYFNVPVGSNFIIYYE